MKNILEYKIGFINGVALGVALGVFIMGLAIIVDLV